MNRSQLKEREEFLKRARAIPVVERPNKPPGPSPADFTNGSSTSITRPAPDIYSQSDGGRRQNQGKFVILSKIINHMMGRHLERFDFPLTLEEILEEIPITDTPPSILKWLEEEALPNNPKIARQENKFIFKPKYKVNGRNELYNLLRTHDTKGLGGIYLKDLKESLPDCENVLASLGSNVIQVENVSEKKTIIFFNDSSSDLRVDDVFKQYWRSVSVEGVHESKIEEYLLKHGIASMTGDKRTFVPAIKTKKGARRNMNRPVRIKDNVHMNDVLQSFKTD